MGERAARGAGRAARGQGPAALRQGRAPHREGPHYQRAYERADARAEQWAGVPAEQWAGVPAEWAGVRAEQWAGNTVGSDPAPRPLQLDQILAPSVARRSFFTSF